MMRVRVSGSWWRPSIDFGDKVSLINLTIFNIGLINVTFSIS